jgi:uncharacterized protein YbjT (DUF2867 family)
MTPVDDPARKPAEGRTAVVAGASGLVGAELLKLLLTVEDYQRVHAVSRRPLPFDHVRLANRNMPLEQVEMRLTGLRCHDAFCCIGSTRRKAGSEAELRRIDVDLVLAFARAARACGAQRFVVLSSTGASGASRHAYLRNKADMEAGLAALQFTSLDVLRPGLLLGWRGEFRLAEFAGTLLVPLVNPLLGGRLHTWRGIHARDVAAAMLGAARSLRRGSYVYAGNGLLALARAGRKAPRPA